jgi:SAM-dependent methyltransferase
MNEWNPRSREIAAEEFGIRVVDESPEKLAAAGETFDVISMVAVLEHCADPTSVVQQYVGLLREKGILVVAVPQFTRLNSLVSQGSSANVIPPLHPSKCGSSAVRLFCCMSMSPTATFGISPCLR